VEKVARGLTIRVRADSNSWEPSMSTKPPRTHSRVPGGRIERLSRISWMAGGALVGGAAESVRRLVNPPDTDASAFLTGANAKWLASQLASMRGAAMKVGQLLSLEGDDFLPKEVADAFAVLRDDADAMPESQLRQALVEAYGEDWERHFDDFDFEPVAAASIGQVHRVHTQDGRDIALKIQYPGVRQSIDSDVDNLATVLRLARLMPPAIDLDDWIGLAKEQLQDESDYLREADCLEQYRELMADEPDVTVPGVHRDLTTQTILAMDYLEGLPLEDLCGPDHESADRDRMGELLLRLLMKELFEIRFTQSDPNFANFLLLPGGRIGLIDLGAAHAVPLPLARGYASICRAASDDDRQGLQEAAETLGFLQGDEDEALIDAFVHILAMASEPFRSEGPYDFGATDLPRRAREASMTLAFERGITGAPPPEALFIQRKLGGVFLLCTKLRARVDVRALAAPYLAAHASLLERPDEKAR